MNEIEKKRLALQDRAIEELFEIVNDEAIRRDDKLVLIRGTLNELNDNLRRLEG